MGGFVEAAKIQQAQRDGGQDIGQVPQVSRRARQVRRLQAGFDRFPELRVGKMMIGLETEDLPHQALVSHLLSHGQSLGDHLVRARVVAGAAEAETVPPQKQRAIGADPVSQGGETPLSYLQGFGVPAGPRQLLGNWGAEAANGLCVA